MQIKLFFMLVTVTALVSCSHHPAGKREVASQIKGNETGNRIEEIQGIIKQAECNKLTGLGTIELQVKKHKTIETTWYKVNSPELCTKEIPSEYFLGNATYLTNLSASNVTSQDVLITAVKIVDDFVVEVTPVKKVNYSDYIKNVTEYDSIGNNREVLDWYFKNRKSGN
jgi:hypothetical protein